MPAQPWPPPSLRPLAAARRPGTLSNKQIHHAYIWQEARKDWGVSVGARAFKRHRYRSPHVHAAWMPSLARSAVACSRNCARRPMMTTCVKGDTVNDLCPFLRFLLLFPTLQAVDPRLAPTLAPWRPSCRATSKPMPEPPPVTNATLGVHRGSDVVVECGDGVGGVGVVIRLRQPANNLNNITNRRQLTARPAPWAGRQRRLRPLPRLLLLLLLPPPLLLAARLWGLVVVSHEMHCSARLLLLVKIDILLLCVTHSQSVSSSATLFVD
jgi:hypothetical protein